MRRLSLPLLVLILLAGTALPAAPKEKGRRGDVIWIHPAYDSLQVQSIAFLPAVSYDNSLKSEKAVEGQLSAALRGSGYRWISAPVTREMLRSAIGDSALAVIRRDIVAKGRVDSSWAPRLCRALRVTALLSARVDLFEQVQVEWNQSGKPSTSIQVRSALVDSGGRLAWSVWGSETAEGPYHDPNAATLGVKGSGLTTEPMTGQGGAPSFEEVCTRLFTRWSAQFPPYRRGDATAESPK